MIYLIRDIFVALIGAAAIGGAAGWLICKWAFGERWAKSQQQLQAMRSQLEAREAELEKLKILPPSQPTTH